MRSPVLPPSLFLASLVAVCGLTCCKPPVKRVQPSSEEGAGGSVSAFFEAGKNAQGVAPEIEKLVRFLIDFAASPDTSSSADARALSLAMASGLPVAIDAKNQFEKRGEIVPSGNPKNRGELVNDGKALIREWESSERRGADDIRGYVADLVNSISPGDAEVALVMETLKKGGIAPDWNRLAEPVSISGSGGVSDKEGKPLGGVEEFVMNHSRIKALVFQENGPAEKESGKILQMTAALIDGDPGAETELIFRQSAGELMFMALGDIKRVLSSRHGALPMGSKIEFSFDDSYSEQDGASAMVGCALMVESLVSGEPTDEVFAVTGSMDSEGQIKRVSGLERKLGAPGDSLCEILAIPEENAADLLDLQIVEGAGVTSAVQIFGISTFDDAWALCRPSALRTEKTRQAIAEFKEIQKVLNQGEGMKWLNNQYTIERLQKVAELAPNHLSARCLLLRATGREPQKLSLGGSLKQIDLAAEPLVKVIRQRRFEPREIMAGEAEWADSARNLRGVRTKLDERVVVVCDRLTEFSDLLKAYANQPPSSPGRIQDALEIIEKAGEAIEREYGGLAEEAGIRGELIL